MIAYLKKLVERIKGGMLQEMYIEAKWMYKYVDKYKWGVVFYIFLGILGTVMSLASGVASKNLIDAVTGYDSSSIGMAAAVIIGMSIGNIVVNAITSRISTKINVKVGNEIRTNIYDRIINTDRE